MAMYTGNITAIAVFYKKNPTSIGKVSRTNAPITTIMLILNGTNPFLLSAPSLLFFFLLIYVTTRIISRIKTAAITASRMYISTITSPMILPKSCKLNVISILPLYAMLLQLGSNAQTLYVTALYIVYSQR